MIRFLKFLWLLIYSRQGQKVFIRTLCRSGDAEHRPKGDGRPPDLHVNSTWICSQLSLQRISTWCMILRHFWLGLQPTLLARRADMLTTRPPSPWFQNLFLLHMLPFWFSQLISASHLVIGPFVFLECIINLIPVLLTLYSSSANQSPVTLQVQVVSQSRFSDVTFGSSRIFSIIHGSCFNTLSLPIRPG